MKIEEVKILLLEDNLDHVDLFIANLEMTSFSSAKIECFENLHEGLLQLNISDFNLIFIDLSLKDSDIANTLEQLPHLASYCPVIVITSLDDKKTILDIIDKGADDCLPKMELNDVLLERVIRFNLDRWKLKQDLINSEKNLNRLANVFRYSQEGIFLTDENNKIIDVNESFSRIYGYSKDEVLGKEPSIFRSRKQEPQFDHKMWADIQTQGFWQGEIWNRKKNGVEFVEFLTISKISNDKDEFSGYVGIFSDMTEQKKYQENLEHIAHFDSLTQLPNRLLLADRLNLAMAQSKRHKKNMAIIYLDLDGFKEINDNHGHDTGDLLLKEITQRMSDLVREEDTLARLGGDEFVAILSNLPKKDSVIHFVSRLLKVISQPVLIKELQLYVSASIGISFYPQENGIEADQLIRQADQAMYQAKQAGKNGYVIFNAEQASLVREQYKLLKGI